jgi:hypothetical protein
MRDKSIKITVPITFKVANVMGDEGGWTHGGLFMRMGGMKFTEGGKECGEISATPGGLPVIHVNKGQLTVIMAPDPMQMFEAIHKAVLKTDFPPENPEPRER